MGLKIPPVYIMKLVKFKVNAIHIKPKFGSKT